MPLLYPEPATLFDYMPKAALFLCDTANCRESLKTVQWQQNEDVKILLEEGVLFKGCDRFAEDFVDLQRHAAQSNTVLLDTFARSVGDIPLRDMVDIRAVQLSSWSGEFSLLREDVREYIGRGYRVAVFAGTERAAASLAEDLTRAGLPAVQSGDLTDLKPGGVRVVPASMSAGMEYPDIKLAVISQAKTGASRGPKRARSCATSAI